MVPIEAIGAPLVVLLDQVEVLVVGSHLQVLLLEEEHHLHHREGVVLAKGSQVNMVEDTPSPPVATIGIFRPDPPPLGQATPKQPVVDQGIPLALHRPA